jgi:hypothetical protein
MPVRLGPLAVRLAHCVRTPDSKIEACRLEGVLREGFAFYFVDALL